MQKKKYLRYQFAHLTVQELLTSKLQKEKLLKKTSCYILNMQNPHSVGSKHDKLQLFQIRLMNL